MQVRIDHQPTPAETARLVAAVAYATRRAALERQARAAVKARRWELVAKLAEQARALDAAMLAGKE